MDRKDQLSFHNLLAMMVLGASIHDMIHVSQTQCDDALLVQSRVHAYRSTFLFGFASFPGNKAPAIPASLVFKMSIERCA